MAGLDDLAAFFRNALRFLAVRTQRVRLRRRFEFRTLASTLFRRFRLTLDRFLPIKKAYSLFCEGNKLFSSTFIGFDVFGLLDTVGAELEAIADDGEAAVKLFSLRFGQIDADIVQDAVDFIRDLFSDGRALFG